MIQIREVLWAAEGGHMGVVNILLAWHNVDVDSVDSSGYTLLSWTALNGHADVVRILVARTDIDVNLKDWYDHTLLSRAAQNGHTYYGCVDHTCDTGGH
jgi:ankyrin repeat protein